MKYLIGLIVANPQRQKAASFNLDEVAEAEGTAKD
jgi:hypothetical protein